MRSLGLKSLSCLLLALVTLFYLIASRYEVEFVVRRLDSQLALFFGAFATLMSGLVCRAFQLSEPSKAALILVDPGLEPKGDLLFQFKAYSVCLLSQQERVVRIFDLPAFVKRLLIFFSFAGLAVGFFQFRELHQLLGVQNRTFFGKEHFCPKEKNDLEEAKLRPECRLIFRAFQLGYAKDLGTCGKKEEEKPTLCFLRQHDEPYIHYAYRKLTDLSAGVATLYRSFNQDELKKQLRDDLDRFEPLVKDRLSELKNDPQSLHVFLSALPSPRTQSLFAKPCDRIYKKLPNRLPQEASASSLAEHALGHLMFDQSYKKAGVKCEEYRLVWEVPAETCKSLIRKPQETLQKMGLLQELEGITDRYQRKRAANPGREYFPPRFFSSVSCMTSDPALGIMPAKLQKATVKIRNSQIEVRALFLPPERPEFSPAIAQFRHTARLMSPTFQYGELQSRSSLLVEPGQAVNETLLNERDFRLTRLGFLRDADVFLGSAWLERRADLLSLYPYHLHLNHFVNRFRESYDQQRGRMK